MRIVYEEVLHHYLDVDANNVDDAEIELEKRNETGEDLFSGGEVISSGITKFDDKTMRPSAIELEKALYAFMAYVEDDSEGTELSYIRDKLTDVCGLSKEECEVLGLGWVFAE